MIYRLTAAIIAWCAVLSAWVPVTAAQQWLQYGPAANWQSSGRLNWDQGLSIAWQKTVGQGRSQIVGLDGEIYLTVGSSQKQDGGDVVCTTKIIAANLKTGETRWSVERRSALREGQQSFSGDVFSPQATPAIIGSRLVAVSFTGQVICINRNDGSVAWEKDLVDDLGASPVQFGFSASPVFDPASTDRIFVMAAGMDGGLCCLAIDDGSLIWKAECKSASYATPVTAAFGGVAQWVIVSEDEVLGVGKSDGSPLWRLELPEAGLTNVPTPLVINDRQLIISGQGCQGTRCISVAQQENAWQVRETWSIPRLQFFYTNWVCIGDRIVLGCTDKFLAALDVNDGTILARWRGFGDGNIVMAGNVIVLLDGRGKLNLLDVANGEDGVVSSLQMSWQSEILQSRCWAPVSIIGENLLLRGDDQLICLERKKPGGREALENMLDSARPLEFQPTPSLPNSAPEVEQILERFETQGEASALALYDRFRLEQKLNQDARIALAEAARQEGLTDVMRLILNQAAEDFPDSPRIDEARKSMLGDR